MPTKAFRKPTRSPKLWVSVNWTKHLRLQWHFFPSVALMFFSLVCLSFKTSGETRLAERLLLLAFFGGKSVSELQLSISENKRLGGPLLLSPWLWAAVPLTGTAAAGLCKSWSESERVSTDWNDMLLGALPTHPGHRADWEIVAHVQVYQFAAAFKVWNQNIKTKKESQQHLCLALNAMSSWRSRSNWMRASTKASLLLRQRQHEPRKKHLL